MTRSARVNYAVEKMFGTQTEPIFSIYLINTDEDLRRVTLGINAGRPSKTEVLPLVAFLPNEFANLRITLTQTPGNLYCGYANSLHYDFAADNAILANLCETAMKKGRLAGNCAKAMMKDALVEATKENCRSFDQNATCQVKTCIPT